MVRKNSVSLPTILRDFILLHSILQLLLTQQTKKMEIKNDKNIAILDSKQMNAIQGGKGRIAGKKGEPESGEPIEIDDFETPL